MPSPSHPHSLTFPAGDKLKQLIALRISSRYLDRLVTRLQQKGAQEAKFLRSADARHCHDMGCRVFQQPADLWLVR